MINPAKIPEQTNCWKYSKLLLKGVQGKHPHRFKTRLKFPTRRITLQANRSTSHVIQTLRGSAGPTGNGESFGGQNEEF